jgi:ribosomal protein L11 methyltransferase
MSWCALDVRSPPETRDAIATWLVDRTGQAVEEQGDGTLISFAESESEASSLLTELQSAFGLGIAATARPLPEVDWSERWRQGLEPRIIGRLTITPSWTVPGGTRARTVIIDPETAFGTGEHGSTRGALLLLDRHLRPGDRVLDLGSGSGILAIAAIKLGAARATGVEIDPETEPVAVGNARRNEVLERVDFLIGDAAALTGLLAPAELIVSNILRLVNQSLLPLIKASLAPGGMAIFSGMELGERSLFLEALGEAGLVSVDEAVDEAWWSVAARAV